MKRGGTYKHVNNTDVAVEVLRIVHIPEKRGYMCKVSWLNVVNPENHFHMGEVEEVFIKAEDMQKWISFSVDKHITQEETK